MAGYPLVIRDALLPGSEGVHHIGIREGRIARISPRPLDGAEILDARGGLLAPAFVDCHTHMDKAFTAAGDRVPRYNDHPFDRDRSIRIGLEYFRRADGEEIRRNILRHAALQVAAGTLFTRTHVDVDSSAGTRAVRAAVEARRMLDGVMEVQIVAFAQSGFLQDRASQALVREAVDLGADLVGGLDPATCEQDIEEALETTFRIAAETGRDIDYHVHDGGTLGVYTLMRLASKARKEGYAGRVTASHCYSLADVPPPWLDQALPLFLDARLGLVTCYSSTPHAFPARELIRRGIPLGCGSDNVRDFWIPFGNADMLQGALIETQRLDYSTNDQLDLVWRMITVEGARVLGVDGGYGVAEGRRADLVVLGASSPQWAIIEQAARRYVIKAGTVVARDGELVPQVRERLGLR